MRRFCRTGCGDVRLTTAGMSVHLMIICFIAIPSTVIIKGLKRYSIASAMVCEHNVCLACHTRTLLTQVAVVTHMLNTLLSTWKINLLKNLCPLHSVIACHSLACMLHCCQPLSSQNGNIEETFKRPARV